MAVLDIVARFNDQASKGLASLGGKLTLAGAPLAALGIMATKAASDMNESMSKVDVVFEKSSASVLAFSETTADAMGISKQAALEAAGGFGNLFKTMGIGLPANAEMSTSLIQLAADLASFNNLDPGDVLGKLRSGLIGEAEPMRSLGVLLTEDTVKAKAMELGLEQVNGEFTQGAKVQARYALMIEQTKTAQGDFTRTADGMANSTRIMQARVADLSAEFGAQLLPIGIQVLGMANRLLGVFKNLSPEVKTAVIFFAGLVVVSGPLVTTVGLLTSAYGFLTGEMFKNKAALVAHKAVAIASAIATNVMAGAQWLLNAALSANPIGLVVIAIAALAAGVIWAYQNVEWFRKIVDSAFSFIKSFIIQSIERTTDVLNFFGRILKAAGLLLRGDFKGAAQEGGSALDELRDRFGDLGKKAQEVLGWLGEHPYVIPVIGLPLTVFGLIKDHIGNLLGWLGENVGNVLGGIGGAFGSLFGGIGEAIGPALGAVGSTIGTMLGVAGEAIGGFLGGTGEAIGGALGSIGETIGPVLGTVGEAIGGFLGSLGEAIGGGLGRAGETVGAWLGWLGEAVGGALGWMGNAVGATLGWLGERIGSVLGGIGEYVGLVFGWMGDRIGEVFGGIGETVGGILGWIGARLGEVLGNISTGIGIAFGWMGDRINDAKNAIGNALGWIGRKIEDFVKLLGTIPGVQGIGDLLGGIGGFLNGLSIPGFILGGTVPGPVGAPQLAIVHGGEQIIPNGGGGGLVIQINAPVYGVNQLEDVIVSALRRAGARGRL